jgi:tetratricopeptide (TPR) repeat protein
MRRRLNWKFLSALLGVVALAGGTVVMVQNLQVNRSAAGLLHQADRAEVEGRLAKSQEYLGRYLGYRPDDTTALARYGLILEKEARTRKEREGALAVLEKVLLGNPSRDDVRLRAARLAIDLTQYPEAREHLVILNEKNLQGGGKRPDGELMDLLGQCDEGEGKYAEAAGKYEKAIEASPDRVECYVRLAGLLRNRLNQAKQADEVMDAGQAEKTAGKAGTVAGKAEKSAGKVKKGLIAANGGSFRAYLARADYCKQYGLPGAAETAAADVRRALELAPEDADVLIAAAAEAMSAGDLKQARSYLERGAETYPKDVRMYWHLATLSQKEKRPEEAVASLEKGVAALPGEFELKWRLAGLLVEAEKYDAAEKQLDDLRAVRYAEELLDYVRAQASIKRAAALRERDPLMAVKKWAEAAAGLERAQAGLAKHPEMAGLAKRACLMLAQCYERLGDQARQLSSYARAVAIDLPEDATVWVAARAGLAAVLEAQGKLDEAEEEYRRIMAREPELKQRAPELKVNAAQNMARLMVRRNANLPPAERNWAGVESALRAAAAAAPDDAGVTILRAQVFAAQGKFEEARGLLEKARDREPDRAENWLALIALAERQGKPDDAASLTDEAERRLGDLVGLRLARARSLLARGGDGVVKGLARLAQDADKFPEDDRKQLLGGLALAYHRAGDTREARRTLDRLEGLPTADLNTLLLSFEMALQEGDTASMERLVPKIQAVESNERRDGVLGPYSKVRLLMFRAGKNEAGVAAALGEARALMTTALAGQPAWALGVLTLAKIDDLAKSPDAALAGYLKAIELGERDPAAYRRTYQLLVERGRNAEADRLMQKLLQWEQTADLLQLASDASLRAQDYGRAEDLAARAVKAAPADYRNHIWLGQVLAASASRAEADGKRPEADARRGDAEKALRRAAELRSDAPEAWLVLVRYLASVQKRDAAEAAIREAQRRLPADRADLALASCYEAVGDDVKARGQYETALKAKPDDVTTLNSAAVYELRSRRLPEAEAHLRKLIEAGKTSPEAAAWARRTLAVVVAAGGDPQRSDKALKVLGLSDDKGAAVPVEDLRTEARVLAMQPGRGPRRQAIDILERVLGRVSNKNDDLFLLTQLYEADGDWPKARDRMKTLLASDAKNPLYLAYYIRALIRRRETAEARTWLNRLEQADPNSPRTVEAKARLLKAQGKGDDAAALLTAFAQDDPARLEPAARLLEQLGLHDAAGQAFTRLADRSKQPEAALALAGFLGRRGRTREALDLCERARKTLPADTVANAAVSVIQAAKGEAADLAPQVARVEGWLEESLRKSPGDAKLMVPRAVLRGIEGRYDDAEAIYRQILRRDEKNAPALNNLAWLLALKFDKGSEAEGLIERAIGLVGPVPALRDTRAVVRLSQGRSDLAVEDLLEANTQQPTAAGYFHLAQAYQMSKDRTAAAKALVQAKTELGLQANDLDPLERAAYERLVGDLARK